jgi:predicted HicB family RNase H-like nuclease
MTEADLNHAPKVQFNVYLPPGLVKQIKHRAIDAGESLSTYVECALAEHLERVAEATGR